MISSGLEGKAEPVGKQEILQSPNVRAAPPTVNQPVPVPSIYQDERGEIHNFRVRNKRINLLYTRKGVMRSGDIHKNRQHDFVFSGKVQVQTLRSDGTSESQVYGPYSYVCIEPYVPHIFNFLEDTIIAEWWEPEPFEAWYYLPFREIVRKSFLATKPGRFLKLDVVESGFKNSKFFGLTTFLLGIAVGFTLARRR